MIKVMFTHPVADYTKWRTSFDAHQALTASSGAKNVSVCTAIDNPNMVSVIGDWDNVEQLNAFAARPDLADAMKDGGVLEKPTLTILNIQN